MKEEEEVDKYGNPTDGNSLPFCCFPDCGCDGSRLCQAENGPNSCSTALNFERGTSFGIDSWLKNNRK